MLVTMKEQLVQAKRDGYGIGAFNVYNLETAVALFEAFDETHSPGIFLAGGPDIPQVLAIVESLATQVYPRIPVSIILDHGRDYEAAVRAIRAGFTAVMIDGSSFSFVENVRVTSEVVHLAHAVGVTVEAELGHVGGARQTRWRSAEGSLPGRMSAGNSWSSPVSTAWRWPSALPTVFIKPGHPPSIWTF